jgi:thiol-disulfide isomerase/thioredoxin
MYALELQSLDSDWNTLRSEIFKRSLLAKTPVKISESTRISSGLASHSIDLKRGAFDKIPLADRAGLAETLKGKTPETRASFEQMQFLRSFLEPKEDLKFNFFIFSPSWCDSSREYRTLLEEYIKKYPDSELHLHSVVVDDPKKEIFSSRLIKQLFPNKKAYSHDNFPKFLALQNIKGHTEVYEEGDALELLSQKFLAKHRGFLDDKTKLFEAIKKAAPSK